MLRSLIGPSILRTRPAAIAGQARCISIDARRAKERIFHVTLVAERRRPTPIAPVFVQRARDFHATSSRNVAYIPLLLSFLKTSTAIQTANAISRVALTFLPVTFVKKMMGHKHLNKIDAKVNDGRTDLDEKRAKALRTVRFHTIAFHVLLFTPVLLFWLTIMASIERTPLTGRLRLILLSPEEEEEIAAQLAGAGWYQAIGEILTEHGQVTLIPPTDWRYAWVRDTLRRLEAVIPVLQREQELLPDWMDGSPDDVPQPPPAEFPLRPRPRASEYFRKFAEAARAREVHPAPHGIPGPPYSLVVVDQPGASNAFSYGFGPDGGGGIVVFSGFLDEVLAKRWPDMSLAVESQTEQGSWWSRLFGSILGVSSAAPPHPVPTEEQTSELAILLAHELSHLVLSHHIETLSSGSIIWPGTISIATDIIRALLFPVTMLFGPFINDALARVGKASESEIIRLTEYCTSQRQEVEADIVSARLLAHAGFDPRDAVHFWEGRQETPRNAECSPALAEERAVSDQTENRLQRLLMGSSHPMNGERVKRLKGELERWEEERRKAREERSAQMGKEDA
ncbi:uncharacterized protein LAESUDRAFT_731958 [Laetiporus sulphureus 93-53]|uniref:Peptidase M48 domain-containing protein n=1 Tax=Laetiporus sulphureus 93-53 TaxID=1314785 RepID=A0A165BDH7_9APHY|nr:uncharacterized protein LAESUDRAFT_731958 [Laetiporus sulphureus 93-53]KZT00805.1 hypothetical protein LAESUDRAFT_731958 [Laetiporus sulphureus 93-53]